MMKNSSCFTHSICTDNNHRSVFFVQGFWFFYACNVCQSSKTEWIFMMFKESFFCFFIITFWMQPKNACSTYSHRRIHVNRNFWDFFHVYKKVQIINQFLSPFYCKWRNDYFAVFWNSFVYNTFKFCHCKCGIFMQPVAVRTFQDDIIRCRNVFCGASNNWLLRAAYIACKQNSGFIAITRICSWRGI